MGHKRHAAARGGWVQLQHHLLNLYLLSRLYPPAQVLMACAGLSRPGDPEVAYIRAVFLTVLSLLMLPHLVHQFKVPSEVTGDDIITSTLRVDAM